MEPLKKLCQSMIKGLGIILLTSLLFGCAGGSTYHEPLMANYWKLTELYGYPITTRDNQREAHLIFTQSGLVKGHTSCNPLFGQFSLKNSTISFQRMASTKMACIGQADDTDKLMMELFKNPLIWLVKGQKLVLFDSKQKPIAHFQVVHF
jgi:heat shock protein HslJ